MLALEADGTTTAWVTLPNTVYSVGQSALGGTVFYTTDGGLHGLVVANKAQNSTGSLSWYGAQNLCSTASAFDAAGQNYTDWFLPTLNQTMVLSASNHIPADISNNSTAFWTSTQADVSNISSWIPSSNTFSVTSIALGTGSVICVRTF